MSKAETLAYDLEAEVVTRVIADKAAAELRRLAALEKAIMDAEPVAWLRNDEDFVVLDKYKTAFSAFENRYRTPLYAIKESK